MEMLLLIFFIIFCLYCIYYLDQKESNRIHNNYIQINIYIIVIYRIHNSYMQIIDELKKLSKEYINGKYDFETYKQKRKSLYESHNIPLDYKEELY